MLTDGGIISKSEYDKLVKKVKKTTLVSNEENQPDEEVNCTLETSVVLESSLGTSVVLESSLGTSVVLESSLEASVVLESSFETSVVLATYFFI